MAKNQKPDYLRRIMEKDVLWGLEVIFLAGIQSGVSTRNENPARKKPGRGDEARQQHLEEQVNYRGWSTCDG